MSYLSFLILLIFSLTASFMNAVKLTPISSADSLISSINGCFSLIETCFAGFCSSFFLAIQCIYSTNIKKFHEYLQIRSKRVNIVYTLYVKDYKLKHLAK